MTTRSVSLLLSLASLLAAPPLFANENNSWGTEPLGPVTPPRFTGPPQMKREPPRFHKKFPTSEPALLLAEKGEARAVLVIPEDAPRATVRAGELLQKYLKEITGSEFPLVREGEVTINQGEGRSLSVTDAQGTAWPAAIWLGATQAANARGISPSSLQPEGYLLRSAGPWLFIVGNDRSNGSDEDLRGTYYAACAFLEEQLGVRWLWPGDLGTVIPKRNEIALPALHEQDEPAIRQRIIRPLNNIEPRQQAGIKRMGGNEEEETEIYRQAGKNRAQWCGHLRLGSSLNLQYRHAYGKWYTTYGKEHPDWFALQPDGSRQQSSDRPRLCKGNPEVAKQAAAQVLEAYRNNPNLDSASISPNDGSAADNFCMCPICRKLDPPNGNPVKIMFTLDKKRTYETYPSLTDRFATFYNRIAEEVAKVNPDAKMGAYAYHVYRDVPLGVKLHPSIIVGFVGFGYFGEASRQADLARWNGWSEAATNLFLRPNLFHQAEALPGLYTRRLAEDMRHCYQTGMMAADFDSLMGHWSTQGVNYYVLAKLLWNPGADPEAILNDYCESGFGKAAPKVHAYLTALEDTTTRLALMDRPTVQKDLRAEDDDTAAPLAKGDPFKNRYFSVFNAEEVAKLRAILAEARALDPDPTVQERITFLECGLDYADLCRDIHEGAKEAKPPREELIAWYRKMFREQPEAINGVYLLWKTGANFRGVK